MKAIIGIVGLLVCSAFQVSAQNNKYDINFSAEQLANKIPKSKVLFFEAYLQESKVDCSILVSDDPKEITLFIFPGKQSSIEEDLYPKYFTVRHQGSQEVLMRGDVKRTGNTQFNLDISTLPKGTYVLSILGLQVGQQLTFANY